MLPATIFRQLGRHRTSFSKGISELIVNDRSATVPAVNVINCLNRYAAATGFIRISLVNIKQYRNLDVATLGRLYADRQKQYLHLKTIQGRTILQEVIDKKRESFIERKNVIVEDIREARHKVKEKVRVKMEEVIERENIVTLPNMLTISRMALAPYIGYVIVDADYNYAITLLAAAGLTDWLDGHIARRWPNQSSKVGSFLDPAADKILMGSLVLSMTYGDLLPLWLVALILFRDVFLMSAGFVIRYISLPPPRTFSRYFDATHATAQLEPTFVSKINTFVQLATVGISLGAPIWGYIDHVALEALWVTTGATTVAAALSYVLNKKTFKILKKTSTKITER